MPLEVVEHGAGGVGGVGDVAATTGEAGNEKGVHRAETQLVRLRTPARVAGVEHSRELSGGEVGVNHQSRGGADLGLHAVGDDAATVVGSAAILPDDGGAHRRAAFGLPQQRGLALIGDADGVDAARIDAGICNRPTAGGEGGLPDGFRVLLYPAWLWIRSVQAMLGTADGTTMPIEHHRPRARCALVDGKHMRHAVPSPSPKPPDITVRHPRIQAVETC